MFKRKARILFLCTGNSCRSQMAEGYAKALGADWLDARSAGIEAHGKNPRAIAVMREDGVDISGQVSNVVDDEMIKWADLIVTVCGHADENCPASPATTRKKHWPLPDPAKATGTDDEIMQEFRSVQKEVKQRVLSMIAGMKMISGETESKGNSTLD